LELVNGQSIVRIFNLDALTVVGIATPDMKMFIVKRGGVLMVYGNRIEKCFHCGKEYICGDCVTNICPDCEKAGHRGLFLNCPICLKDNAIEASASIEDLEKKNKYLESEVGKLQAELNKHRWIPVSERLPEKNGRYWVTDNITAWVSHFSIYTGVFSYEKFLIGYWKPIILPKGKVDYEA